jgi:hypothetical protein
MKIEDVYSSVKSEILKDASEIIVLLESLPENTRNWALVNSLGYADSKVKEAEEILRELVESISKFDFQIQ